MNRIMIIPVTVATVAALCVAALGATITDLGPWYQALAKPAWNPPDVVFPMGWTLIYALITQSVWALAAGLSTIAPGHAGKAMGFALGRDQGKILGISR